MMFVEHTLYWVKGEMLEGRLTAFAGALLLLSSSLFWKFGTSPDSKAIVIPLAVGGLLIIVGGLSLSFTNQNRLKVYPGLYQQASSDFVKQEKERVEGFQYMYQTAKVFITVFMILGLISMWWSKSPLLRYIGIVLMLYGCTLTIVDYFSKERADIYYEHILKELAS